MQLFLEEHEPFSHGVTLFDSTRFFLASEITFFRSSRLSLPRRLFHILLKYPLKILTLFQLMLMTYIFGML